MNPPSRESVPAERIRLSVSKGVCSLRSRPKGQYVTQRQSSDLGCAGLSFMPARGLLKPPLV